MTDEAIADTTDYKALYEQSKASVGKLELKNQELLGESKSVKAKAKEAEEAQALAAEEAARKSGRVEDLDKSWNEKFNNRESELLAQLKERDGQIGGLTSGAQFLKMAAELAVEGSVEVLNTLIKDRFATEYVEGKPVTVILDQEGKRSAMALAELKTELYNDPALAPLISGSKASGSGGAGGKNGGGAVTFSKMTQTEKAIFANQNPEQYRSMVN